MHSSPAVPSGTGSPSAPTIFSAVNGSGTPAEVLLRSKPSSGRVWVISGLASVMPMMTIGSAPKASRIASSMLGGMVVPPVNAIRSVDAAR